MNIGLTDNRDAFLIEKRIGCTGHNAQFTLQLVPTLDSSCLTAVFGNQVLHGNL